MVRSVWKGPFVEASLLKKADAARASGRHDVIKIWSRRSTILPQVVGLVFGVYKGQKQEILAHHFLLDRHRHMLLAVVDAEHQSYELRKNGRAAAPDLDDVVTAGRARDICLLEQGAFDERAFPD